MNRFKHRLPVAAMVAVLLVTTFAGIASANLAGSLFEGNDGNLVVDTAGNIDWVTPAPGQHAADDLATGQNDNSFGGGTKENDINVNVVDGSIPNSKADLGRFAVGSETRPNGHIYLYLAWTRNNLSGTVNFDFEINQAEQPDLTTPGAKTLNRTTGDLLITYDFQGGSQKPTIGARRWSGSTWTAVSIAAQATEAEVNRNGTVAENLTGTGSIDRPAFAFGEAAIDLTAANLLPSGGGSGSCSGFSSIFVKSRASDAFTSAVKDFIAPIPVDLNTCGAITISKTAKHAAAESGEIAQSGVTFTLDGEGEYVTGDDGTVCISGLAQGSYEVAEVVPDGYAGQDPVTVNVNAKGTCSSGSFAADFTNTPLTDITVSVDSQVAGGTDSTIDCEPTDDDPDVNTPDDTGDGSLTLSDLEPTTIVCTIVIDP